MPNRFTKSLPYQTTTAGYDDLMGLPSTAKLGSINPPTWAKFRDDGAGSQGVGAYDFPGGAAQYDLHFQYQLNHSAKIGTDLRFHVHWTPKTNPTGSGQTVIWGMEYSFAPINGYFGQTIVVPEVTFNFGATLTGWQWKHILTSIATFTIPSQTVSSVVMVRMYRAGGDTFPGTVSLMGFDCHVLLDSMGSIPDTSKT